MKTEITYGELTSCDPLDTPDNVPDGSVKREITVVDYTEHGIVTSVVTEYICRRDVHVMHPGLTMNTSEGRLN